jgi:hypothetical protein
MRTLRSRGMKTRLGLRRDRKGARLNRMTTIIKTSTKQTKIAKDKKYPGVDSVDWKVKGTDGKAVKGADGKQLSSPNFTAVTAMASKYTQETGLFAQAVRA